jgi:hypothetical protein
LCSEPLVLGRELADGEELSMSSTLLATSLARLLVGISVQIVMVHMLGSVLSVSGVGDSVKSAVGHEVPSSLALVGEH